MFTQIFFGIGIVIPAVSIYYLKRRYKLKLKQLNHQAVSNNYYHCLFTTMDNFNCRPHIIEKSPCNDNCSVHYLEKIATFIASARKTISVCMYFATLEQIKTELVKARKHGVVVRIITDPTMFKMNRCNFRALKYQYDFQVKVPYYRNTFMHHKFILVDECDVDLGKLMMGSLNLTIQGLAHNFEFVVFTNDMKIIECYSREFEILWKDCVPDIYVAEVLDQTK